MTVRVEGAARLRRTLRAAGSDLSDLKAANRAAATVVAGAARPPRRTGKLARSVRATATVRAGVVKAGRKSVAWAGPVHWGWPARGIKAQPFLTTAAQATEPVWLPIYEREMHSAINQVKGK